jgi:hypothetical protein
LDRLHGVLVGGAKLKVRHIYVDGDTTIAELRSQISGEGCASGVK